jgi:hypothetical protein
LANQRGGNPRTSGVGRERPWALIIIGGALALILIIFAVIVILDVRQQAGRTPPGEVETIDVGPGGQHSSGNVDYDRTPPAGGEHNPVWQNCGFYPDPISDENAVHSMEHGAVWITYSPDLPEAEVNTLRDLAQNGDYILVSPYPGLDSPLVATAWGKQLELESADDEALEQFIGAYREGPQTPEPGAACTGGTGQPA